jgi:hypothetical protein
VSDFYEQPRFETLLAEAPEGKHKVKVLLLQPIRDLHVSLFSPAWSCKVFALNSLAFLLQDVVAVHEIELGLMESSTLTYSQQVMVLVSPLTNDCTVLVIRSGTEHSHYKSCPCIIS